MKVVLKNVRISFCDALFTPQQYQGKGDFKYSSTFLIPKDDPQVEKVLKAIKHETDKAWGVGASKFIEAIKANPKGGFCFVDGETKTNRDGEIYNGYEGCMSLFARSISKDTKKPPLVLDRDKTPLTEKDCKIYAGCYVNCSINISAYTTANGDYVTAELLAVQFNKDGDAFGGVVASTSDFDDMSDLGEDEDLI